MRVTQNDNSADSISSNQAKKFDFPHMRFKFKRITAVTRGHVGIQTNISERLNAGYSMKLTNSSAA
jgi:hypothetical protein